MEEHAVKKDREIRPGFVLSILVHVLFVAIFLLPLLPAPPQAKPEQSVNVELVPQPEEKQEIATKANEKPDQPPKPTPKPDEKPQKTAEAKQEQQPEGKKPDEPQKQPESENKEQAEKPAAKPADTPSDKPAEKPEQQASAAETPLPDMKGDQKDPTTTQEAEASEQPNDAPPTPPNDNAAEQQAAADAAAQAAEQAQNSQPPADAKGQDANAATPPAKDSSSKPPASPPDVLATNEPSDMQVQQPQAPSTGEGSSPAQDAADASSSAPQEQSPTDQTKDETKTEPQIAVPTVRPSPTEQTSQGQSASSSQGGQTGGAALVTEPQPKPNAPKRAIQAKKLYSSAEMARLSKSDYDAWKKMPLRKRVSYLCNSEEKLQFGHDMGAVGFVNSALSPAMLSDTSLFGDGAVVETSSGLQRVEFTCQVDGEALKVIAFSYTVRGRVSPNELDKLGLAGN